MGKGARLHHYVPRFYLKHFAAPGRGARVHCFDKAEGRAFPANVSRIACESYFYEGGDGEPSKGVEARLAELDAVCSEACAKLLRVRALSAMADGDRYALAAFVATQLVRTREMRETHRSLAKAVRVALEGEELAPALEREVRLAETEERLRDQHVGQFRHRRRYADILFSMKWILITNATAHDFWSSDNPVTKYNPLANGEPGWLGLESRGVQLHLALDPRLAVCVCCPEVYAGRPETHAAEPEHVTFHNDRQVRWSTRYVFSSVGDFTLARRILADDASVGDVNRPRVVLG